MKEENLTLAAYTTIASLMLVCVAYAAVRIMEKIVPGWEGAYLAWFYGLVAVEAMLSSRAIRRGVGLTMEPLLYRISEWVVMLIILKILLYVVSDPRALLADLPRWRENFLQSFFTPGYAVAAFLGFTVWILAVQFEDLLYPLEVNSRVIEVERTTGFATERIRIREKLIEMILLVGGALLLMTTLLRLDFRSSFGIRPPIGLGTVPVLVYFGLALGLLSLTQLSTLRIRWGLAEIPVSRELGRRWLVLGGGFLGVLILIAAFLPTGYTVSLLDALGTVMFLIAYGVGVILFLITLPFIYLFSFLMRLLGGTAERSSPVIPPPQPLFTNTPHTQAAWQELLGSLVFWSMLLGIVGFSIYYFFKQHREITRRVGRIPFFGGLLRMLQFIDTWLRGVNRKISRSIGNGWERLRSRGNEVGTGTPWNYLSLRRLSLRQQVLFFYSAMLRRGGEQGYPRQPGDTPYEYAGILRLRHPEADQDIDGLTDEFVLARYSRHEVTRQQVSRVRRYWEHIRSVLRSRLKR